MDEDAPLVDELAALRADVVGAIAQVDQLRRRVGEQSVVDDAQPTPLDSRQRLALRGVVVFGAFAMCWLLVRWLTRARANARGRTRTASGT